MPRVNLKPWVNACDLPDFVGSIRPAWSPHERVSPARRSIVWKQEIRGGSIGTYASFLRVLGLQADLDVLAKDDALGRKLQDMNLPSRA